MEKVKLSWNQPICQSCWNKREPNREPVRIRQPFWRQCAFCGSATKQGIFVRHDPKDVLYPAVEGG